MEQLVKWPFGKADVLSPAAAANITVAVKNAKTVVKLSGLTGATTLAIDTANSSLEVGHELHVDVQQNATGRNVTFGTGLVAQVLTGVANDRDVVSFVYDGASFIGVSNVKIVDA